jgi:hypothetical protein
MIKGVYAYTRRIHVESVFVGGAAEALEGGRGGPWRAVEDGVYIVQW